MTLNLDRTASDKAADLLASFVLEDGRRWGAAASDFQWATARWALDPSAPMARWDSRPRGGSKTTDAAALCAVLMVAVLPPGSSLACFAVDKDQARLLGDALRGFVARTAPLRGELGVDAYAATTRNGSRLEILSADAASAWGRKDSFVVADEVTAWPATTNARELWEALYSSLGKVPGAKLLAICTSGDPAAWTAGIYRSALKSPAWTVAETPGPLEWASPSFLAEQRSMLPESSYRRLHLNQWCAPDDVLASRDDLLACATLEGDLPPQSGCQYRMGVDAGWTNDRYVVTIAHGEPVRDERGRLVGQRVVVDRQKAWAGTKKRPVDFETTENYIVEMARLYRPCKVICDPAQLVNSMQRLRRAGVHVEPYIFTQPSVGKLALSLMLAIRNRVLAIPNDPALLDELANIRLHEGTTPGTYRMDPNSAKGHDDRAVSLALCVHAIVDQADQGAGFLEYMRRTVAERDDPVAAMSASQRAIARTQRAIERAEQMAAKRHPRCPGHSFIPETRLCRYCGEAAPGAVA
jgi:hypothetical protein